MILTTCRVPCIKYKAYTQTKVSGSNTLACRATAAETDQSRLADAHAIL